MKPDIDGLLNYYVDQYYQEKIHNTDGFARAGMLQGLIWICQYFGISDDDLGEERWNKIRGDK